MEILRDTEEQLTCQAVQLANYVDQQINGGAREEFADATSVTQEPGADLGEGSAYADSSDVNFVVRTLGCDACNGFASLSYDGSVRAPKCYVSGSCELEWAQRYPDRYETPGGGSSTRQLICGAEIGCMARIALSSRNGRPVPTLAHGTCELAERGDNWQARREDAIREQDPVDPELGIEVFDGEGSGREAEG
mgnify:CR=1 FL=1